jgi:hypothetical protein
MRINDDKEQAARRRVQEDQIRRIVREEIVAALRVLSRSAHDLDDYDTPEITGRALDAVGNVADNVIRRLTCEHEFKDYQPNSCWSCGEPAPAPVNPFEEEKPNGAS